MSTLTPAISILSSRMVHMLCSEFTSLPVQCSWSRLDAPFAMPGARAQRVPSPEPGACACLKRAEKQAATMTPQRYG